MLLSKFHQVLDAIKAGKLNHIFLIGGCDGAEGSRRQGSNAFFSRLFYISRVSVRLLSRDNSPPDWGDHFPPLPPPPLMLLILLLTMNDNAIIRYYSKVSGMMSENSAILTLGCAKYRLLGQDFGMVPGTNLPRLLDMGQCNDAYGAVSINCRCLVVSSRSGIPMRQSVLGFVTHSHGIGLCDYGDGDVDPGGCCSC